jgi:hypothetical protein
MTAHPIPSNLTVQEFRMASSFLRKLVSEAKSSRHILKPRAQWIRLNIETLDARILPSVTAALKGGILSVVADTTHGTSQVEIIQAKDQVIVEDTGALVDTFAIDQVQQIQFQYDPFALNLDAGKGQMTLTGFPVSEADLDLGDSSLTATVNATLPDGTALNLAGAVNTDGTFDLAGSAQNIQVGNFTLPNANFDLSDQAMTVAADLTLGNDTVSLKGPLDTAGNYDLTGTADVTVDGFSLPGASFELTNTNMAVAAPVTIRSDTVNLAGSVDSDANYNLTGTADVTVASFPLHADFTLTNDSLAVTAPVTIGSDTVSLGGSVDSQGNYALIGTADITFASFPLHAGFTLTTDSLAVMATVTVGNDSVGLAGSVDTAGNYSLMGSADITVASFAIHGDSTLTKDSLAVAAMVTVGSNTVNLAGSVDSAGNYDLTGTANITVASFSLNVSFELTDANLSVSADLAIPNVSTVHFAGAVDNQGNFSLSGSATITIGRFSFSPAFTLTNDSLAVAADVTVTAVGTLHFEGTADSQGNFSLTTSANVTIAVFSLDATFPLATTAQFGGGIGISAARATLTLGSLTATATTVTGQFDFTTTKFALAVGQMSLVLPGVLQAGASNLSVNYDPNAAPGQVLVALASATATITPLNGATITVTGLSIRDNGFAIAGGSGSLAGFQLNGFLDIQQPTVSLPSISFTVGQSLTFGGLLTVSASQATLFPGKTYTASFTNVSGGYDVTTGAFALTVGQFSLQIGDVLQAAASGVTVNYRPGQPLTDPVLTVASGTITLPRFNIQGQIQRLVVTQQGFKFDDLSITKTDTIHLANLADFTGLRIEITNYGVDYSSGISFTGAITVSTARAVLLPGKTVTGAATNIAGRFDFSQPDKPTFSFHADTVSVTLGSVLTLGATGIDFNTDPGPGQYIAQFGSLTAQLTFLGITGQGRNFAIDASGSFVTLPGFGVSLSTTTDAGTLKWLSWLPIQISRLDLQWPNFSQNPLNVTIILSASVNAMVPGTGVGLSGSVTNFVIDVGLLQQGKFPVTGFDSVSSQAGGTLFGNTLSAGLFVSSLRLDDQGNAIPDNDTTTPVAKRVLYGGFEGTVTIMGIGFEVRLGLSELGPLQGFMRLGVPVPIDPSGVTGLTLSGFRAGVSFNRTLPSVTDARDLGTVAGFQPTSDLTSAQWEALLRQSVVNQEKDVQNCMQDGSCSAFSALQGNVTLEGGATLCSSYASSAFQANGDILFSTDGKFFLKGSVTFGGGSLAIAGKIYLDVAQAVHGHVSLLWLAQVPETPTILTVYGGVTLMVHAPTVTLTVTGGIDIAAFGLAGLSVTGTAVFTVSTTTQVLDLDVTGKMSLDPLGDLVNVGGKLHLQFNPTTHAPEYGGAFAMQPGDLNQLRDLGLTLNGTAAFRFNSTSVQHTQDLVIAGQTQTFVLPPASVSVQVIGTASFKLGGQDWFSLDGGLAISFRAVLDANGNPVFRDVVESDGTHLHIPVLILDVLVDAKLSIGPAGKQAKFTTLGYLRISTADGIAAKVVVAFDPQDSQGLASLGIAIDGTFSIELNSSSKALTYDIPAGFPDFQGSRHITIAAGPSLQVYGSGHFIVQQKYVLTGTFTLLVTPTQLTGNFTATLALDRLGALNAQGTLRIASDGALGTLTLTAGGDGALHGTGFKFTGAFVLQVNTTGVTQQGIPPGVQVSATGDLVAGANNDFDLHGMFTLAIGTGGLTAGVTNATLTVAGTQVTANGQLQIPSSGGMIGSLVVTIGGDGVLHGTGFKIAATFGFQVNTTGTTQQNIPPGVRVTANGDLTVGANNDFDLNGTFALTVASGGLSVGVTATVSVFGQVLPVNGTAAILSGAHSGFVLDVFFNLTNFPVAIFTINASAELAINTTDQPQPGGRGNTLPARTATIQVGDATHHATVAALGFTLDGVMAIGWQGGSLVLNAPSLHLDFFGLVQRNFSGYVRSINDCSLSAGGAIRKYSGDGCWGFNVSGTVTISSNPQHYFYATGSGQVTGLCITVSASAEIVISGSAVIARSAIHTSLGDINIQITLGTVGQAPTNPVIDSFLVPTNVPEESPVSLSATAFDPSGQNRPITYS